MTQIRVGIESREILRLPVRHLRVRVRVLLPLVKGTIRMGLREPN